VAVTDFQIAAICAATFGAALIQATIGFGFALFLMPPLATLLGPVDAVVVSTLLGAVSNSRILAGAWRHADWRLVLPMLAGAAVGMPVGLAALLAADPRLLRAAIALVVLASTLVIWRSRPLPWHGRPMELGAGWLSGVLNTSTGTNGPPVVLYLQGIRMAPARFRGTLAAYFSASSAIALVLLAARGAVGPRTIWLALASLPVLLAGYAIGVRAFRRIDPARFRHLVIGILVVTAVVAFLSSVSGG
jgi:uncharacterized membrane protein YfcA